MKYLKQFLAGSSIFVVFPFYYIVFSFGKQREYSIRDYIFFAPVYIGIWNIISLIIAEKYNLSIKTRFIIGPILMFFSTLFGIWCINNILKKKTYNFSKIEWYLYVVKLLLAYLITWNLVIYNVEINI